MKRLVLVLAAVGLAVTPLASHAAPKPPKKVVRTVTLSYNLTCGVHVSAGASTVLTGACTDVNVFTVTANKTEKYMSFTVADSSGTPTGIQLWTNDDYEGSVTYHCSGGKAQQKKGGGSYSFATSFGPADCQGLPTSGTITVKLSNLP